MQLRKFPTVNYIERCWHMCNQISDSPTGETHDISHIECNWVDRPGALSSLKDNGR